MNDLLAAKKLAEEIVNEDDAFHLDDASAKLLAQALLIAVERYHDAHVEKERWRAEVDFWLMSQSHEPDGITGPMRTCGMCQCWSPVESRPEFGMCGGGSHMKGHQTSVDWFCGDFRPKAARHDS